MKSEKMNPLDFWKILNQTTVIENPWITVQNRHYRLPNGKELKDYFIVEKRDVVVIVPFNRSGMTLLMKEYERGVAEVGHKFPAGQVEPGESPIQAAQREMAEELGTTAKRLIPLGERYVEPGFLTNRAHYFLALDVGISRAVKSKNSLELFVGEWIAFSSVSALIAKGEIKNPFVIVGYTLAEKKLTSLGKL